MTGRSKENFSPRQLATVLSRFPDTRRFWVAYSGGPDSHALIYAMAALHDVMPDIELCAVHVNHGLLVAALDWEKFCRAICRDLHIRYKSMVVTVPQRDGQSLEAAARTVRYEAFASVMVAGDVLLTAHTQDDQAETLLLQLLRGSGADGLAGMPECGVFARGWLARPLLHFPRALVHGYTASLPTTPIEDPSNRDQRLARNYLRHEVLPVIHRRWPSSSITLSRAATHLAESSGLTKELASIDLQQVRNTQTSTLSVPGLLALDGARCRNVIRAWIRESKVRLPSTAQLARVEHDVLRSEPSRNPVVAWGEMSIRRYAETLYLLQRPGKEEHTQSFSWDMNISQCLSRGRLLARREQGCGVSAQLVSDDHVCVRFRTGGERLRPVGRAHHTSLKQLLQEARIPPWERGDVPLIYIDNQLAAVAGLCVCEPFGAGQQELGWLIEWEFV